MFKIRVPVVDVIAYVAERPQLYEAVKRYLNAENTQEAWGALQDIQRLDKAES